MKSALSLVCLLALTACGPKEEKPKSPDPDRPRAARHAMARAATRPAARPADMRAAPMQPAKVQRTLLIDQREVTVDAAKGTATYKPNRNVRRASYTTYIFDHKEYAAMMGKAVKRKVVIQIENESVRVHDPMNPRIASPSGGFRYKTIRAKIIKRLP